MNLRHLTSFGNDLARGFLHLLYPGTCGACNGSLTPEQAGFCPACRAALTTDPHNSCPRCASTIGPFTHLDDGCHHCRTHRFHFERVLRLGPYDGLLREVILRLKHGTGEGLAETLGELWAGHALPRLREARADVVIPVPLHWWRRWTRGYNQSESLARAIAAHLHLPCRPRWLRHPEHSPANSPDCHRPPSQRPRCLPHAAGRRSEGKGRSPRR